MRAPLILALVIVFTSLSAFSQVAPAAHKLGSGIDIGAGFTESSAYWDNVRVFGGSAWVGWTPSWFKGLGLELDVRDLQRNDGGSSDSFKFRQLSFGGGPIYRWHHYQKFHPYAKLITGYGKLDVEGANPVYTHDSSVVLEPALGVEYRAVQRLWVRAEYGDQIWPGLYHFYPSTYQSHGFTLGADYRF